MALYLFECDPSEHEFWKSQFPGMDVRFERSPLTTADQARDIAADAEIISVFVHSRLTRDVIAEIPNLRMIETRSTGFNHIDLEAAGERGIPVCNVPNYGENTIAEHAFALLLATSRHIVAGALRTREGSFSADGLMGFDLRGKTLGVVGAGRIGRHMLKMASGFDMRLLAFDMYPDAELAERLSVEYVSLEKLVEESDVISLHVSLNSGTQHLLGRELLEHCKPGMVLINSARGELVDTAALVDLLKSGRIAAAGLDVVEDEGTLLRGEARPEVRELIAMPNVLLTPHMAFSSKEAIERIRDVSAENIRGYRDGNLVNVVGQA